MRTETPHTDPANPRGGVESRGAPRAPPAPGCVEPLGAGSTARGSPQRPAREPDDICRAAAGGALPGHGARNGRRCLEPPPTPRPPWAARGAQHGPAPPPPSLGSPLTAHFGPSRAGPGWRLLPGAPRRAGGAAGGAARHGSARLRCAAACGSPGKGFLSLSRVYFRVVAATGPSPVTLTSSRGHCSG